jgi:DNA primase
VAVSGTALTERHLSRIKYLADNIIFAFDADDAGMNAAERSFKVALSLGFNVKVAALPEGMDPADVITKDVNKWNEIITNSQNVIDFQLNLLKEISTGERDKNKFLSTSVLPYVAELPSNIEKAQYVSKISGIMGISEDPVWDDLKKVAVTQQRVPEESVSRLGDSKRTRLEIIVRRIVGLLKHNASHELGLSKGYSAEIEDILRKECEDYLKKAKEDIDVILHETELYMDEKNDIQKQLDELMENLKSELVKDKMSILQSEIKKAHTIGDKKLEEELLKKYNDISKDKYKGKK